MKLPRITAMALLVLAELSCARTPVQTLPLDADIERLQKQLAQKKERLHNQVSQDIVRLEKEGRTAGSDKERGSSDPSARVTSLRQAVMENSPAVVLWNLLREGKERIPAGADSLLLLARERNNRVAVAVFEVAERDGDEGARVAQILAMQDVLMRHRELLAEFVFRGIDASLRSSPLYDADALRKKVVELEARQTLLTKLPAAEFDAADSAVKVYLTAPSQVGFTEAITSTSDYLAALTRLLRLEAWKEGVSPSLDERFGAAAQNLSMLLK